MSVSLVSAWANEETPLFVYSKDLFPILSTSVLNVSSLTANNQVQAPLLSTLALNVSSINGITNPLPLQENGNNAGVLSGYTLPASAWTSLVSTPATFTWIAGKTYDVQTVLGGNITTAGNTGYINYGLDLVGALGPATGTTPLNIWSQNLQSNVGQQSATHLLRGLIKPNTTDTGSIVAFAYSQASGQVGSFQMANLPTHPAVVRQLN